MNIQEVNLCTSKLVLPQGFYKKRNAFFRVLGDGVMQVLKWEYDIREKLHFLNFGLVSLYEELEEKDFTPSWCCTKYCAMHLIDKNYYRTSLGWGDLTMTGNGENLIVGGSNIWRTGAGYQDAYERAKAIHLRKVSYEAQLEEVQRVVIPVLNKTDTQAALLETMFRCEKNPQPYEAIFPLLRCRRYQEALEIIRWFRNNNYEGMLRHQQKHQRQAEERARIAYEKFLRWEETVQCGEESTCAWLQCNYQRNQVMFEEMILPKRRRSQKNSEK